MKEDNTRDKHIYILLGVIGIILSATLVNLLTGYANPARFEYVVQYIPLKAEKNKKQEAKSIGLNISDSIVKNDTWKTDKTDHVKKVIVQDQQFEKKNSEIRFRLIDEIPKVRNGVFV